MGFVAQAGISELRFTELEVLHRNSPDAWRAFPCLEIIFQSERQMQQFMRYDSKDPISERLYGGALCFLATSGAPFIDARTASSPSLSTRTLIIRPKEGYQAEFESLAIRWLKQMFKDKDIEERLLKASPFSLFSQGMIALLPLILVIGMEVLWGMSREE